MEAKQNTETFDGISQELFWLLQAMLFEFGMQMENYYILENPKTCYGGWIGISNLKKSSLQVSLEKLKFGMQMPN